MGLLDWLFGKRTRPDAASTGRQYEYLTGNVELAIRVNRGEPLDAVGDEIMAMWTPGNEHLWDEYDVESLVDSLDKRRVVVNQLIYARISIYRALRSKGRDIRGRDPLEHIGDCDGEFERLSALFPSLFHPPEAPVRDPSPASDDTNLTGTWVGDYSQHSRSSPITAELVQSGDRLTGSMRDGEPDRTSTVFEVAAEAGLPPGADEQIVARLRESFPDAPSSEIRYVTHLPPESALEGRVRGSTVTFLKTYRGDHFSGYKVGDRLVGHRVSGHAVQYSGRLSPDGMEIEGRWWIDPDPESGGIRAEGSFLLRRQAVG